MKKSYKLEEICCASCGAKIETALNKLDGMTNVTVNVMTQKLNFETEATDLDVILREAQKIVRKYEPDCKIIV